MGAISHLRFVLLLETKTWNRMIRKQQSASVLLMEMTTCEDTMVYRRVVAKDDTNQCCRLLAYPKTSK
jgi:hypothetical protein